MEHKSDDYEKFINAMQDALLIIDENLKIIDANLLVQTWYGYTKDEIKELSLNDIRAPETRELISTQMQDVLANNGGKWETIHVRKDGTTFPVEVSCTPIIVEKKRHYYHVVRDVSARKKYEMELLVAEERYHQLVDLFPDTIYIHRDGIILFMNQAGLKMFGATSADQIVGNTVWSLYTPERHGIVRARNQMMQKTKQPAPIIEHTMVRLDGKLINVEAIARLINFEGSEAFYVILRDITERKRTNLFLEMEYAVAKNLIENVNAVDAINNVIKIICKTLNYEIGSVWSINKNDQLIHCIGSYAADSVDVIHAPNYQLIRDPNKGLVASILSSSHPLWVQDIRTEFPTEFESEDKYQQLIGIPLRNGNDVVGVIELKSALKRDKEKNVLDALQTMGIQIGSYLHSKNVERELSYITKHHRITGLANREFFLEILQHKVRMSHDCDRPLALILCSINGLNTITEGIGHGAVDSLVKQIATRIESVCGDIENIASFRADEFAIVVTNVGEAEKLTQFVDKLITTLSEPFVVLNQKVTISLNCGIAVCPKDGIDAESLIRSAMIALTTAKKNGGGDVQYCNAEMIIRAKRKLSMEQDLRQALEKDEFILNFQPVVDSETRIVTGFESLLRWKHEGNYVSPADFIPIAESSDFIVFLGEWIIRTAAKQSKIWNETSDHPICVAVNVSGVQFIRSSVPDTIAEILNEVGLDPAFLKVELTESEIMDDVQRSIRTLTQLKDMGVKISIDDFGTGYSSLNYLRHLPIDYIKIDQSFVKNMLINENDATIVRTIAGLAQNLGYKVIAEGVETQEQLEFLNTMGNFEIQGYFFSRPLSVDEATEFLKLGKIT